MPAPVLFQPAAALRFQRGVDTIVGALRPTLGPRPRLVAVDTGISGKPPELLDNGALIARRMIELPDRDEDVGAMFVRGMLWRLHEQAGDGTTTAALLFQAIYACGLCYIAAGGDPMALRQQLDRGLDLLLGELEAMTRPIAGQPQLTSWRSRSAMTRRWPRCACGSPHVRGAGDEIRAMPGVEFGSPPRAC